MEEIIKKIIESINRESIGLLANILTIVMSFLALIIICVGWIKKRPKKYRFSFPTGHNESFIYKHQKHVRLKVKIKIANIGDMGSNMHIKIIQTTVEKPRIEYSDFDVDIAGITYKKTIILPYRHSDNLRIIFYCGGIKTKANVEFKIIEKGSESYKNSMLFNERTEKLE